jgi:hypothetical protein
MGFIDNTLYFVPVGTKGGINQFVWIIKSKMMARIGEVQSISQTFQGKVMNYYVTFTTADALKYFKDQLDGGMLCADTGTLYLLVPIDDNRCWNSD